MIILYFFCGEFGFRLCLGMEKGTNIFTLSVSKTLF